MSEHGAITANIHIDISALVQDKATKLKDKRINVYNIDEVSLVREQVSQSIKDSFEINFRKGSYDSYIYINWVNISNNEVIYRSFDTPDYQVTDYANAVITILAHARHGNHHQLQEWFLLMIETLENLGVRVDLDGYLSNYKIVDDWEEDFYTVHRGKHINCKVK